MAAKLMKAVQYNSYGEGVSGLKVIYVHYYVFNFACFFFLSYN